ncbi:MAG: RlmF-related methyltransferase [Candidatus Hodarchaeota archaeon]
MNPLSLPTKKCGLPFKEAIRLDPALKKYTIGKNRIDLGNTEALLLYNRLIIQNFLSLDFFIPPGYLVPTICSRWAFISWILQHHSPDPSRVLEVGTGASAILALILAKIGCLVEATEINEVACEYAQKNIDINGLKCKIIVRKVVADHILRDLYNSIAHFDIIICNPPQYDKDYFQRQITKKGFMGQESELVGGNIGHEFIVRLLIELKSFKNSPPLYFQLTSQKIQPKINSYLSGEDYSFIEEQKSIGTRYRFYYRVTF